MDGIMTVADLIAELQEYPAEAPVMVAVIKYPEEFKVQIKDGSASWSNHTDVECQPLEHEEITMIDGVVHLAVELTDYDAQRHFAGG